MRSTVGQDLLLFYIVCDESGSMGENGGIDQVNAALPDLHHAISQDPIVVDKSRLAIIAFSDDAQVLLPLSKAIDIEEMPGVQDSGATSYGAAFSLLDVTIRTDFEMLKREGYRVHRPCVFFISDGDPTDDWRPAYDALMSREWRPSIISFGVGDAGRDPSTLAQVATLRCFAGRDRSRAGTALSNVMTSIGRTIINSTTRRRGDEVTVDVPDTIDGFETVPVGGPAR